MLARLYGRLLPYPIMGLIYLFAYGLWLIAILSVVTSIAWIWEYTLGTSTGYVASGASIGSASFMTLLYGGGIAVCGFAMFMSAKGLYKRYRLDRRDPLGTQIDSAYVTPFFYAYLWLAAALAVAFVNAHYMVSIGVDIQGF